MRNNRRLSKRLSSRLLRRLPRRLMKRKSRQLMIQRKLQMIPRRHLMTLKATPKLRLLHPHKPLRLHLAVLQSSNLLQLPKLPHQLLLLPQ